MQTITTGQAANHIRNSGSTIFTVTFVKRSTGTLRTITGRNARSVTKGKNGNGLSYSQADNGLLGIAMFNPGPRTANGRFTTGQEFSSNDFRSIGIEGIRKLTIRGKEYDVR